MVRRGDSPRPRFASIVREAAEDPEIARNAPYSTPVRRLDEAGAAKRPVVRQAL
jgi:glycine dehydrogenase subunit 2